MPIATPTIPTFDFAAPVDTAAVCAALKQTGGIVLRHVAGPAALAQMERDVRPHIAGDKAWTGSFFPAQTRRVTGLVTKSPTFTETVLMNPVYQAVCNTFLTLYHTGHLGKEFVDCESKPQLQNTIVFAIGPGSADARNQPLHRDDSIYHVKHTETTADEYEYGRDVAIGFFLAGKRTTRANGATRFIPGSHLWPHLRSGNDSDCVYAELEAGDAFMMLASCQHGGSANTTADEERLVLSCFMTKGIYRQEENQYLTHDPEYMKTIPIETARVVGWNLSTPLLSWVAFDDPICLLHPELPPLEELY